MREYFEKFDESLYNQAAEQMLLGTLMLRNELLAEVTEIIGEDDFYEWIHREIFARMKTMIDAGELANPVTLTPIFAAQFREAKLDPEYLLKLAEGISLAFASPKHYARTLLDLSAKRKMINMFGEFCDRMQLGTESADVIQNELIGRVSKQIESVGKQRVSSYAEEFEALTKSKLGDVYKTMIPELDAAMLGGLYPGKIYGFAARKKVGKSTLCVTLSRALTNQGVRHLVVLGEMGSREFSERMAAAELGKSSLIFRSREGVDPSLVGKMGKLQAEFSDIALLRDCPNLTFNDLKTYLEQAVLSRFGISGFILDYWQLVGGKPNNQSTSEHLDNVAQWMAGFAKKHNIWGIVMAQLNQEGNTRGSEGMRLAFDQVYKLDRTKREPEGYEAGAWLEMLETRYTPWEDVGSSGYPALRMSQYGTHFEEISA
jgi:replicative DNA helicase